MGLQGMINDVLEQSDFDLAPFAPKEAEAIDALRRGERRTLARVITALRSDGPAGDDQRRARAVGLRPRALRAEGGRGDRRLAPRRAPHARARDHRAPI